MRLDTVGGETGTAQRRGEPVNDAEVGTRVAHHAGFGHASSTARIAFASSV